MNIASIEANPEVKEAAMVLRELEKRGLKEPAIAAGWTRSLITDSTTNDIDVSYVGSIHYKEAQDILKSVLADLGIDNPQWDVEGIWNAELAYGVHHTVDNFLLYYLNSIDSVYLAADGHLHDPTGFGFEDAKTKTLRINQYDRDGREPTPSEEVNICLENCRRIAKFKWEPTNESVKRITEGAASWGKLSKDEVAYFVTKLGKKYSAAERPNAQKIYAKYGWGFVFDL